MQKIIPLLRPVAPVLAQVLESPFHALAIKYIRNHMPEKLVDAEAEDEAQLHALLSGPAGLHALQALDQQFAAELKPLKLDVSDIAPTGKHKESAVVSPQFSLSLMFVAAYFIIVIIMFLVEASDQHNMQKGENSFMDELQILLGALTAGVGQVLSYWFGRGQDKTSKQPAANQLK